MSRFVRPSKYRHVWGSPHKETYGNLKPTASAWDSSVAKVSARYLSVNWQASGGGAFAVIPLQHTGKLPDLFPLCRAHTAPVLDTDWSPFDDSLVASAGEDGKVAITRVDESVLEAAFSDGIVNDLEPISTGHKMGHGRKVGQVLFHPTAENVLASASYEVKVWDVSTGEAKVEFDAQPDMVGSLSFDWTGSGLATTCKDKKLRLFDTRSGGAPHTTADSHNGVKGSRVCWMGDLDRICTTGFSRMSDRQVFVWDARKLTAPVKQLTVDTSSGTLMPYFNVGNNILFFAGKGDGNIRYYEYENDDLFALSEYKSSEPQRGIAFAPARSLNVSECEIARAYKVGANTVEPISFIVPRKSDSFQSDIYPPAPSDKPALSASEFFSGKTAAPLLINLENHSQAPVQDYKKKPATVSASATPVHSRQSTAEPSKPAPVAAAPSVESTGGIVPPDPTYSPAEVPRNESPTPAAAPAVKASPASATDGAGAGSGSGSGEAAEVASLKKENEALKQELSERDHLIRKLELQVETLRVNARKARDALAD